MLTVEGVGALCGALLFFVIVWVVVRPNEFNAGQHLRLVGWDLTAISVGFALVAFAEPDSVLCKGIEAVSLGRRELGSMVVAFVFLASYCWAGVARFRAMNSRELDCARRFTSGALSWTVGICLVLATARMAQRDGGVYSWIAIGLNTVVAVCLGLLVYTVLAARADPQSLAALLVSRTGRRGRFTRGIDGVLHRISRRLDLQYWMSRPMRMLSEQDQFTVVSRLSAARTSRARELLRMYSEDASLPQITRQRARGALGLGRKKGPQPEV